MYERTPGGPFLVGGMKGISLHKVVRTVHMVLNMARGQIVDVLISNLAKYFDIIAQDVHPVVGSHLGLGTADHLSTHTEEYKYTMPLGPCTAGCFNSTWAFPKAPGCHSGPRICSVHGFGVWSVCRPPMHHPMMMWVDDTITILQGEERHVQGAPVD